MSGLPPSINAALQAALLSALSNFLAQMLGAWKSSKHFEPSMAPILRFFVFTLITTPPNYKWQAFLERTYPTYPTAVEVKKRDDVEEKAPVPPPANARTNAKDPVRINKSNIVRKLLLDQGFGSPINNALFILGMSFLSGNPWEQMIWNLKRDFWMFQFAGWKLWPMVALISFSVVPFERRVLFGSLVSLGWTIYISFLLGEA